MKFSHSRVDLYRQCTYKFDLRYNKQLETLPNYDANNPLIVGTMVHSSIEKSLKDAIQEYYDSYPIISDDHIHEIMKLEVLHPVVMEVLKDAFHGKWEHEVKIETNDFIGFIDLVTHNEDGTVNIIDFKYSNSIDHYMESGQLHEYKYIYEKIYRKKVKHLLFIFIPKVGIKQKKDEELYNFRKRLIQELGKTSVQIKEVTYDPNKVIDWYKGVKSILEAKEYPKNPNYLCNWCEYKEFCQDNIDYNIKNKEELDMLPSSERRVLGERKKRKVWIYGVPTSGKTTVLDDSPNPLNLNTDGNIEEVTMPVLPIRDIITVEGRITKKKFAWEIFKDAIAELEKKQNDFQTIIVDLMEDTYEHCRLYMYDKLGIEHESDNSFKAWDMVRTEFLSTLKRLMALDYENIFLLSHEDTSKDLTKKSGDKITRIAPNIQEKAANKIAGMVDMVIRTIKKSETTRTFEIPSSEVVFGGTRLHGVTATELPLSWDNIMSVYENRNNTVSKEEPKPGRRTKKEVKEPKNIEQPNIRPVENLIATEDRYFYHAESDAYWMVKKGEIIPDDIDAQMSNEITKEEYEKNFTEEVQEIEQTEEPKVEVVEPEKTTRRAKKTEENPTATKDTYIYIPSKDDYLLVKTGYKLPGLKYIEVSKEEYEENMEPVEEEVKGTLQSQLEEEVKEEVKEQPVKRTRKSRS